MKDAEVKHRCAANWLFFVSCLVPSLSFAQVVPASPNTSQQGQVETHMVPVTATRRLVFDVVVTGKSHKPVESLAQQDFTVLDDGHPVQIEQFSLIHGASADPPPQLFFLIDEVNATDQEVIYTFASIKRFLTQSQGQLAYPTSLVFFTESGIQVQTLPSRDGRSLATALDRVGVSRRLIEQRSGFWGSNELLNRSLAALTTFIEQERTKPGRKIVLWISPGWPLFDSVLSSLLPSQEQSIFNFSKFFSNGLQDDRITLDCIDPSGAADAGTMYSARYLGFLKPLESPERAEFGDIALQVIAAQSGGNVLIGNDSLLNYFKHSIDDLDLYYEITIPTAESSRENPFHDLKVKVSQPGLKVRTIDGYYRYQ